MTKKKKGAIDKIVMGAIIGTAVGSVVGLAVAPKKGKDTRKDVKELGKLAKETATGVGKIAKKLLFKSKKNKSEEPRDHKGLKEIPRESPEAAHAESERDEINRSTHF